MDILEYFSSIPSIDKNTSFWMVRAKRGFFFDEFLREEFIAIGWNLLKKSTLSISLTSSQSKHLKKQIKDVYNESKPGTALNKCERFCYQVKEGDIAVLVDNRRVAFAQIGEYYESADPNLTVELEKEIHKQIEKANPNLDSFACPYIKRRKISVIRVLNAEDTMSPYLQSAMARNWHSLSDLNEYAELILSGCFDTFLYKGRLTMTFRVTQRDDINVLDLASFVLNSAKIVSNNHPEKVTVKTTLHSPGDIVLQIAQTLIDNPISIGIVFIAIFGGKIGNFESNSLIGTIKDIINSGYERKKKAIELRKLEAEANIAEQEALSKKFENIEKLKELQLSTADSYVEPLMDAAEKLQVQPSQSTILDITELMQKQSKSSDNRT